MLSHALFRTQQSLPALARFRCRLLDDACASPAYAPRPCRQGSPKAALRASCACLQASIGSPPSLWWPSFMKVGHRSASTRCKKSSLQQRALPSSCVRMIWSGRGSSAARHRSLIRLGISGCGNCVLSLSSEWLRTPLISLSPCTAMSSTQDCCLVPERLLGCTAFATVRLC